MKKIYETPIAEKLEFDYTNTVVASGPPQNLFGTVHEQWCHSGDANTSKEIKA